MKYRIVRNGYPVYLSKFEQDALRNYRNDLKEKYLYTGPDFNPNELPKILNDINRAIEAGSFADSPIMEPLKKYMAVRESLLVANQRTTFRSKAMTQARADLDAFAEGLIRQGNPEFARLYDRVLAQETDPAGLDEVANQ